VHRRGDVALHGRLSKAACAVAKATAIAYLWFIALTLLVKILFGIFS
jgi:hypothetical protein